MRRVTHAHTLHSARGRPVCWLLLYETKPSLHWNSHCSSAFSVPPGSHSPQPALAIGGASSMPNAQTAPHLSWNEAEPARLEGCAINR